MPPAVVIPAVAIAVLYMRGVRRVRPWMPAQFPRWRVAAFLGGLVMLVVALVSPLDAFGGLLLWAHMLQHVILMLVGPPLLLLGAPGIPLLRGLPGSVARDAIGPFLASPRLRRVAELVTHPVSAWLALVGCTWAWHAPAAYQLALRSPGWHAAEHASFVTAALLFWWPVVQPWPSRARWPRWTVLPYLILADLQNTLFSALFTFSGRVIYPFYATVPRLGGVTPLDDQVAAGAIMWVPGSLAFLLPAAVIVTGILGPAASAGPTRVVARLPDTGRPRRRFDLLDAPVVGWILRRPLSRRLVQAALLVVAAAIVMDGLLGPQMGPMNLAGVLPWTYWRALTVVTLLVAGNFFCFACPFMLPRAIARRIAVPRLRWPERLRSKWFAITLLVAFLWSYETFDLWDSPWWTAWLIVAYFAGALTVDALFKGASFCKYVCPIGQFHFVHSLVSPLEVSVRRPDACAECRTHDCLRGNERSRGCELDLFLPRKVSNLDCTFCLDCVHACPHDNVGILAGTAVRDLVQDPPRASLGRLSRRADVAVLALILVFGAFAAAAAMVAPVRTWQEAVAGRLGLASAKPIMSVMLLAVLVPLPISFAWLAEASARAIGVRTVTHELGRRFALTLIPVGLTMWVAHLLFHLVSGWSSVLPITQRLLLDIGWLGAGPPDWSSTGTGMSGHHLLGVEILLLDVGLLLTLYAMWRTARSSFPRALTALGAMLPWASLAVGLYCTGIWTFLQPMQMRGMVMH
jgi:cytochrome c oxidase assembly factor CtaG